MLVIDAFVHACLFNRVTEVTKLLAEGVDINGGDCNGRTGLMGAMRMGYTEVAIILLAHNDIKLDTTDVTGRTALHYACINNKVESVKLFLEHTDCSKDLVQAKTVSGNTAEMLAQKKGNHECTRLVREYAATTVNEDTESIDDLVEFITGQRGKKKNTKKCKNSDQAISALTDNKTVNIDVTNNDNDDKGNTDIFEARGVDTEDGQSKFKLLRKAEVELEFRIAEKQMSLKTCERDVKDIIDLRSVEMKHLISIIRKSRDEHNTKVKEIESLDKELLDLEEKTIEIHAKKSKIIEESDANYERVLKYEDEKHNLEKYIEEQLQMKEHEEVTINKEIKDLKKKLLETKKLIKNQPNEMLICDKKCVAVEANKEFVDFIENQIEEKEKELECPVCYEVAKAPILMCSDQHLICSNCKPRIKNCPECRVLYDGNIRRHRYAEKTAEQLARLKEKKVKLISSKLICDSTSN